MRFIRHRLTAAVLGCAAAVSCNGMLPFTQTGEFSADAAAQIIFSNNACTVFEDGSPFKGADISSVISLEQSGVVFRDAQGNPKDIFATLKEYGVNTIRVRIWNDPTHSQSGATYGGGACDVERAVEIAARCAAVGLKLMPDFHYSDFWADPAKQKAPKAWEGYSHAQKQQAIYDFTADTLARLEATGVEIPMVQVGNETTGGMCGTLLSDYDWSAEGWQLVTDLYNAGASAVRNFNADTLVALHFTNPEKAGNYEYYAKMLSQCHADYDVFATSYYPYWHGTMENLSSVLNTVAQSYDKMVMVAETSWIYTTENPDQFANTISGDGDLGEYVSYAVSTQGQADCLRDVFTAVQSVENGKGIGVFYWEPAWLPVGTEYNSNLQKWEQYGSGWASQASQEYDPDGKYYGGSAVDNQALFDADGVPLESLSVFNEVRGDRVAEDPHNLLVNPGFDRQNGWTDAPEGWELHGTADGHFDVRQEDVKNGSCALHWYADTPFRDSSVQTQHQAQQNGRYTFTVQLQGDALSSYTVEIAVNNTVTDTVSGSLTGWNNWQSVSAAADAREGDTVTIRLIINGEAGSYGSADACTLYYSQPAETTVTTEETHTPPLHLNGDVNCDGLVKIDDVILLNRFLAEDNSIAVSHQGLINADSDGDGDVKGNDATHILRMLAGLKQEKKGKSPEEFVGIL